MSIFERVFLYNTLGYSFDTLLTSFPQVTPCFHALPVHIAAAATNDGASKNA